MGVRLDQVDQRRAELRARRAMTQAANGRRPRRLRRVPRQQFPRGVRLQYQRAILAIVRDVAERIRTEVLPLAQRLAEQTRQTDPSTRQDAPADEFGDALDALRVNVMGSGRFVRSVEVGASAAVQGTVSHNARELNRVFEATLGVGLPAAEPFLDDFIIAATRENVRRTTALVATEFAEAEGVVLSAFRRGLSARDLARQLDERFNIVENRARLIARDQIASLNGELNRLRQTNVGVTSYIWRTSQDERVREEHEALEGERFTWASGSPEGHPGEPINCRCIAEPVLGDLIEATEPAFV